MTDKAVSSITNVGTSDTGDIGYLVRDGNSRRFNLGLMIGAGLADTGEQLPADTGAASAVKLMSPRGVLRMIKDREKDSSIFNVLDYGAVADVQLKSDGVITNGSLTLTSATASFATSTDVGKTIVIDDADVISSGTVTINLTTDEFTLNSHGFTINDRVSFSTTGALPTGLTANTIYYVRDATTNTFKVAVSKGGQARDVSGSQSGTHTVRWLRPLKTTIASVNSATSVELAAAPTVTGAGRNIQWGTDSTTGFDAAIDACEAAGGGVVWVPDGIYQASTIKLAHRSGITFRGSIWGVNQITTPATYTGIGSIILPIQQTSLLNCLGSVQLRVEDLQIGFSGGAAVGTAALLVGDSTARSGDAYEFRNVYVTGRWASTPLYVRGVPIDIRNCRFWNYAGTSTSYAGIFTRDNVHSLASPHAGITIATANGNPNASVHDTEFHEFTGFATPNGSVLVRGALYLTFTTCLLDASDETKGVLELYTADGTSCIVTGDDCTFYSESSTDTGAFTNAFGLYHTGDLTWYGKGNQWTVTTRAGGGGTLTDYEIGYGVPNVPLEVTEGGTGITTATQGDTLYYNSGTAFTKLAKDTNATRYYSNTGTNNNPAWALVNLSNGVTGTLGSWSLSGSYTGITAVGTLTSLTVAGAVSISGGDSIITRTSGNALAIGRLGATTPAFNVNTSSANCITGIDITAQATGLGIGLTATGETNVNLRLDGAGSGTITLGNSSTGNILLNRTTAITSNGGSALAVGRQGASSPAFNVNASAASSITGIDITANSTGNGVAVSATGETNVALKIDAAGSGTITLNGTGTGLVQVGRTVIPTANDGAALGQTGNQFSDLFLAEGGVINFDNGDVTVTQSGNSLTVAGGNLIFPGTATNDDAAAGNVGEYQSVSVAVGSAVSLTSTVAKTITSLSLTAGDWDVWGVVVNSNGAGTTINVIESSVSLTTDTLSTLGLSGRHREYGNAANVVFSLPTGVRRISIASTTTVYLVAFVNFAVSTCDGYGELCARRVR